LHIGALTQEEVKNKRLLAFAGRFNFNSWLDVFRKQDPGKPWPEDDPTQALDTRRVNGETELDILRRFWEGWLDKLWGQHLEGIGKSLISKNMNTTWYA
jgi:hypothetical protein